MAIVAVVDSGVNLQHVDLAPRLWLNPGEVAGNGLDDDGNGVIDDIHGFDVITGQAISGDPNGHGSHCAGIVAITSAGAELMAIRLLGVDGSGSFADAITGWNYALLNGAKVINNSWGAGVNPANLPALQEIVAIGESRFGAVFVAAAGNEATNTDQVPHSPSGLAGVLSVGASDDTGNRASFSNFGASTVDLFAPGVQILSADAFSTSGRVRFSGTSMASPVVAGALARLADANPQATAAQLKQSVLSTVVQRQALQGLALSGGVLANSFTGAFTAPLSSDVSGAAPVLPAPDSGGSGGSSGQGGRKVRRGRSGRRSVAGTAICVVKDAASKASVNALLDRRASTEDVEWPAAFGNRICILRYATEQDRFKAVRQRLERSGLFESVERDYIVSIAAGESAAPGAADRTALPGVTAGALELADAAAGMPLL